MDSRQNVDPDDGRTSLVFSVRGPIPIQLGNLTAKLIKYQLKQNNLILDDSMSNYWSGSSVLDLIFPQPETVSEIRFRNFYTSRLSLLVRFDDSVQAPPKREHLAWAAAAVRFMQSNDGIFFSVKFNSFQTLSLARLRGVESTEGIKIGRNRE